MSNRAARKAYLAVMRSAGTRALAIGVLVVAGLASAPFSGQTPAPRKTAAGKDEIGGALERLIPPLMKAGDVPGLPQPLRWTTHLSLTFSHWSTTYTRQNASVTLV